MLFLKRHYSAVRAVIMSRGETLYRDRRFWRRWVPSFVLVACVISAYHFTFSPPRDFPAGSMVSIEYGTPVSNIASELGDLNIVAHPSILAFLLRLSGESLNIQAGTYLFYAPENVFVVAYRLALGSYGFPFVRLTFPEGETARDLAERVHNIFPNISESEFLSKSEPYEGYLFPDTYFLPPSATISSIVKMMRTNFDTKTMSLSDEIQTSGHSLSDIITMASLIEREARTNADKHIVAGILYNRIERNMLLQVDAVFGYIYGRDTYSPSFSDLKVDSPYNTYTHKGLPPGPIGNPGIESIEAALRPTKTDYLYYLTGRDGLMHYAKTYVAHQANVKKYLR